MKNNLNNNTRELSVIDLIDESKSKGTLTIESLLGSIPKGVKNLERFLEEMTEYLKKEALEEKELEAKKKRARILINQTQAMKDYKALSKKVKDKKKNNDQLVLVLLGARKAAEAAGVKSKTLKMLQDASMNARVESDQEGEGY